MTRVVELALAAVGLLTVLWACAYFGPDLYVGARHAFWARMPHEHFTYGGARIVTPEGRLGEHDCFWPLTGGCHRCGQKAPSRYRQRGR